MAAPMDSVMSPATAIALGQLGGLGVLDLEGLWTRYDDPEPLLAEIAGLDPATATPRMQEIYAEPIKPELVSARLKEIRDAGVTVAGALTPQRTQELWRVVVDSGCDLFVIRGTTVSAEHVSGPGRAAEPQALHLRARRAGHRRRLRDVHRGAAPDAHRGGRRAGRLRWGRRAHDADDARHPRADGQRRRRCRRGAAGLPRRERRPLRPRHRRRRHGHLGRPGQGDRLRRRRGDARRRPRPVGRGSRPRLALGPGGAPPRAAARRPGPGRHGGAR